MKIVTIVGARPQFIKLASFSREIRKYYNEIIVHTGQHFDKEMSKLFFSDLNIPNPKYNLMINGGNHGEQTGKMLQSLENVLTIEKPEIVVVFGDTNSTLAGSLAAVKQNIKTIHIEAGLRSFNRSMPEEINRIVSDHTSDYLFAPTKTAMLNLKREGLISKSFLTGDIMVDSIAFAKSINKLNVHRKIYDNYYLLTLHRPYNVDDPEKLFNILSQLGSLKKTIVFPVHPRTRENLEKNKFKLNSNIKIIKPVGYLEFIELQDKADRIITDSGGIQKEAYILHKPCITIRSETEWIETVNAGWNLLIENEKEDCFCEKINSFQPPRTHPSLFGENVAEKMIRIITEKILMIN